MSPVLQGGLPCSGIVRTLPHTLVYGTTKYQGLGIPSLDTDQGIAHISKLLQHGHQPIITGNLMRASLQALQVELGISGFPLEQTFLRVGFLATECWVKHAWEFMLSSGFTIQSSASDPQLQLRRVNDILLLESFLASNLGSDTLCCLNRCRIFLQVSTLSDITTGNGLKITTSAWQGNPDNTRPTYFEWPAQSCPPAINSVLWTAALQSTFCSNSRSLRSPVGAWTNKFLKEHWIWYFSPSLERLYRHSTQTVPGTWFFLSSSPRTTKSQCYDVLYECNTSYQ